MKSLPSLRKNSTTWTVKMVKDVCLNGTVVNTKKYSSPVPLVGLYIAAASMVCFLLILCDVWAGFRRRKYWFPCRFFTINSATLTLISIATKIPFDLTTTMPSALDQLSKLFGTVFICVAMCFMFPSVATNAEFESYANVISLTIFVITVVVNICIQLATGVIFYFFVEHIIILVCMLILLIRFWYSVIDLSALKSEYADQHVDLIGKGVGSMLARLKLCYMYSYHCCPQLYVSRVLYLGDLAGVCMTCLIVLVQGILRSYISEDLRFCQGFSDYGWSMWLVVASQSLTVAVVTVVIGRRYLINLSHWETRPHGLLLHVDPYIQFQYLFSLIKLPKFAEKIFRFVIFLPLFVFNLFLMFVELAFWRVLVLCRILHKEHTSVENFEVFKNQLRSCNVVVENWKVEKGVADMERCVEISKRASPQHVTKLLSDVPPSRESSFSIGSSGQGIKISSLHLILLVEMNKLVQTPRSHDKVPLSNILDEVFEIIHFIDSKLNVSSSTSRLELMMASVIHQYSLVSGLGEFFLTQRVDSHTHKSQFRLKSKTVWWACNTHYMARVSKHHLREATHLLNDRLNYLLGECCIEQLFVDMLVTFLAQLPAAIYKHILDSPIEEYEERVRLGLGFICKLESLKSHVSFSLPPGGNITSLLVTQTSLSNMHVQGSPGTTDPTPIVEGGEIQDGAQVPEQQV